MDVEKEILSDLEKTGLKPIIWKCLHDTFALLFNVEDSFKLFDYCDEHGLNVLGMDGFRILPDGRQPDLSFIYAGHTTELNREFMLMDMKERPLEMKDLYLEFVLERKK